MGVTKTSFWANWPVDWVLPKISMKTPIRTANVPLERNKSRSTRNYCFLVSVGNNMVQMFKKFDLMVFEVCMKRQTTEGWRTHTHAHDTVLYSINSIHSIRNKCRYWSVQKLSVNRLRKEIRLSPKFVGFVWYVRWSWWEQSQRIGKVPLMMGSRTKINNFSILRVKIEEDAKILTFDVYRFTVNHLLMFVI